MLNLLNRILILLLALNLYTPTAIIADDHSKQSTLAEVSTSDDALLIYDESTSDDALPIYIEIVKEHETIQEGVPFSLILHFKIDENWHTYWKNPGDLGMPINIDWTLPEGFTVNEIHWPTPHRFETDTAVGIGYVDELKLIVDLTAPEKLKENEALEIGASISWLACSDSMCLPGTSNVSTKLIAQNEKSNTTSITFEKARQNLPKLNWDLNARHENDDLIHLKIKLPTNHTVPFVKAYFFPEETDFIDHKTVTNFNIKPNDLNTDFHYQMTLKRQGSQKFDQLKGVLVFVNEDETVKESVAVNISLDKSEDEIALLSKSEIENQILKLLPNEATKTLPKEPPHSEFEGHFEMALLFAFIGGMILNLMPCVLPVLSLKIFSFVKMSGENRKLCFQHGLSFSFGVLISFWALAGALLILQAYGQSVGWGFQLQEPIFVAMLASIIFILGLNLFGVMELGTSVTSAAGNINHKAKGLTSSFLSGILATALATPCTGPFLGSAVGYAVTLPSVSALLIFTMLGAGMAFPYLLLSAYPSLLRFIPKPGNWMITFKEIMGFLMMATTIWLLFVFTAQTDSLSLIMLLSSFFLFSVSCWIYGKWVTPMKKKRTRSIGLISSLVFLAFGIFVIFESVNSAPLDQTKTEEVASISGWEPFSPKRIAELQAQGIPVFVDFTAKWCLICQTNHMSLASTAVEEKFKFADVVKMKADWTKKDAIITEELAKFGRNSVPLYVLYGKNKDEAATILPQVLTSDSVINYLNEL